MDLPIYCAYALHQKHANYLHTDKGRLLVLQACVHKN